MCKQVWQNGFQTGAVFAHHVSGNFALVSDPIVAAKARRLDGLEERVNPVRQRIEDSRLFEMRKLLAECLGNGQVIKPGKGVVVARIGNPLLVKIAGQTCPAIDVYLNLE